MKMHGCVEEETSNRMSTFQRHHSFTTDSCSSSLENPMPMKFSTHYHRSNGIDGYSYPSSNTIPFPLPYYQ